MALKKSELYSSLWQSCDELRGGMDASQYKDYVLTLLFLKYVSDKYAGDPHAVIVVPEGGSFDDMVKLKGDKEIGDKINKIIGRLAEENKLRGVIDVADFNDEDKLGKGQEMVDRLSSLIGIFDDIDLRANRADGDDLLGDAYEYLMRHFATESGKSKGQFYTPAEVSRVMAKLLGIGPETSQDRSVYDPTCGSGSLLLKVSHEAPRGLSIFGQEMDVATAALARMNMILHNNPTAVIWTGNTLANPCWKEDGSLKTFDFVVANPPFSYKAWSNGLDPEHDPYERFEYGIPPAKNGDYAFLLHILKSMKSTGKGAVILPHGVLFRGGAEGNIRRELVRRGFIKAIIGLPANLFYGTGIPACILVLDKENAAECAGIFMIDASKDFMKDGAKNRLRERDIHKIVDVYSTEAEVLRYSQMVPLAEIEANDYNLNIPRYIDSSEPEDLHDLNAHLNGGIPNRDIDALGDYWQVFPTLRETLFRPCERKGYSLAAVAPNEVKRTILDHPEFGAFRARILERFYAWRDPNRTVLMGLNGETDPRALITELSESLLDRFEGAPLVDSYAIYQHLMDYWFETMQDDVYAIVEEGWQAAALPRELVAEKGKKRTETPDLVVGRRKYKTDLIPPELIIRRYFATEEEQIETLAREIEELERRLEEMEEANGGEDGVLNEIRESGKKVKRSDVLDRLNDYVTLMLQAHAPEMLDRLNEAQEALDAAQSSRMSIEEDPEYQSFLAPLKGKRGVTQSKLNTRLKQLKGSQSQEATMLEEMATAMNREKSAKKRLKEAVAESESAASQIEKKSPGLPEVREVRILRDYLSLMDRMADAGKRHKETLKARDEAVLRQYPQLREDEIKELVVDDKWLASIESGVQAEIERVTQRLAGRIQMLEERYAEPLPAILGDVEELSKKVNEHLRKMGLEWRVGV